jgi:hypothetical protein
MPSTTCFHNGITTTVFQEAYRVFDHTGTFYPAKGVFNPDADRRDGPIGGLLQWSEFPTRGVFLGLHARDPMACIALEPPGLLETTALWEGITFQIREAFLLGLPFIRGTQAAEVTGLIDYEEVFDRVTLLLAAVVVLLVLWISGAVDRSLRASLPTRGGDFPAVACVANLAAHSAAVRAGSRSWCAQA